MKKMGTTIILMVSCLLLLFETSSTNAQTLTPAPAPAPEFVNLTHLLSVAGPFQTFLTLVESTKVIQTLQNQANNTEEGITIFVPKDQAFSSLKNPSLSNITQEQKKSLLLFHALPKYYSLADFKNLSESNPVSTFSGGQFTLNFTDVSGTVHITSGWTDTKVSSSVFSTDPVALYQIDKVLIPEAIFGPPPPPSPTPAPAPAPVSDNAPAADSPIGTGDEESSPAPKSSPTSSSYKNSNWGVLNYLIFTVSGGLILVL